MALLSSVLALILQQILSPLWLLAAGRFYSIILVILGDKELLLSSSSSRFPGLMFTGSERVTLYQSVLPGTDSAVSLTGPLQASAAQGWVGSTQTSWMSQDGGGVAKGNVLLLPGGGNSRSPLPFLWARTGSGGGRSFYLGAESPGSVIASGPRLASCTFNSAV